MNISKHFDQQLNSLTRSLHRKHRYRTVRTHSVTAGYLARSTLDGHHLIVAPWKRERPLLDTEDHHTDAMTGQRIAWTWRCYCCGKLGITAIANGGSRIDAIRLLEDLIAETIEDHT
jgi:hypothetical protein